MPTKIGIIGDVENMIDDYLDVTKMFDLSFQLGDMSTRAYDKLTDVRHRFFKGNHDNYEISSDCDLGKFGVVDVCGIKFGWIRGANSIDLYRRSDHWYAEELSYTELNEAIQLMVQHKPSVILTHDCPQCVVVQFGIYDTSRTRNSLQALFERYKPDSWFFGHHHRSFQTIIDDTKFRCLNQLESYEIIVLRTFPAWKSRINHVSQQQETTRTPAHQSQPAPNCTNPYHPSHDS